MSDLQENYTLKQYLQEIIANDVEIFNTLIKWGEGDIQEFKQLLEILESPYDKSVETTKQKGDRLENLVEFIIRKSYFFEVYKNVHTETNEIDEIIVLSDCGRQALKKYGLSRDLIPIEADTFLGECKNYDSNLGVTYVGKFYSLLSVTDMPFGIIFTQKGLTGDSEGYKDAYGLTKVLRMIEKNQKGRDLYILTFTLEDYKKLAEGVSFFELVKAKKMELKMASDYNNFIKDNEHANAEVIKNILLEKKIETCN